MIANSGLTRGTDYWILQEGSYTGQGGGNSAITLTYRVKYESWKLLYDYIRGFAWWDGDSLRREIAEEHPTIKGWRCNGNISYDQFKTSFSGDDEPQPEFMKLVATFQPLPYAFLADDEKNYEWERYTSREVEYSADLISSGQGFFKYVDSGIPLATAPTKSETTQILTYTWHQIPVWDGSYSGWVDEEGIPINTAINNANLRLPNHYRILNTLNKTNADWFDIYNHPPGTLLFLGADKKLLEPSLSEDLFTFYYDIIFKFAYRNAGCPVFAYPQQYAMGWDWSYNWLRKTYDLYTDDGTSSGKTMYERVDIADLWKADYPTTCPEIGSDSGGE